MTTLHKDFTIMTPWESRLDGHLSYPIATEAGRQYLTTASSRAHTTKWYRPTHTSLTVARGISCQESRVSSCRKFVA